tara:strand:+ start:15118 stop:15465 length:348 start_codon:yes stop_codon:yes gene_type:complete
MTLDQFLTELNEKPENIQFTDTIQLIDTYYDFTPCEFTNGKQLNAAKQNNGSCKLLSFAQLNKLNIEQTLQCFGNYYRVDVLQHPENDDHQNIRNLMLYGWEGISFKGTPLTIKS